MIKTIIKIIAIVVLAIFQLALITKITILGSIPDLILILAVALVFKNRFQNAILVAAVGGIVLDLVSPLRFGVFTLIFLIIILMINYLLLKTIPSPNNLMAFFIFLGSFLFLDLVIFLAIRVWPSWQILLSSSIEALWAVLILYLISGEISKEEEIKLA